MTKPAYDALSLSMSYLFMALGVAVVICAAAWSRQERKARKAAVPGADTVGYIRLISGSGKRVNKKQRFPVPAEGTLGSAKACDVPLPSAEIPARAGRLTLTQAGMLLAPIPGRAVRINGKDYRVPVLLDEHSHIEWGALAFHLDLTEGATALPAARPSPPLSDGADSGGDSMDASEPQKPRIFRIKRGSPLDQAESDHIEDIDDIDDIDESDERDPGEPD